jgi:hypothetical protein
MSNTYAQNVQTGSAAERTILGVLPSWAPLLAGAFAVGFGLAAIAYILSAVFRLPELSVWAKSEIGEMVATGIIVAAVLIAVVFADGIFVAATGQTPMGVSTTFADEVTDKSVEVFMQTLRISRVIGLVSGIPPQYQTAAESGNKKSPLAQIKDMATSEGRKGQTIPVLILALSAFNINYQKFYGITPFQAYFGLVQTTVIGAATFSIALRTVLAFINETALPVLIPLGVFLCCFSLTRKMGRTLIAFGIGLYFFFPAALIISQSMYNSAFKADTPIPHIDEPGIRFFGEEGSAIIAATIQRFIVTLVTLIPSIFGPMPPPFVGLCPSIASACGIAYPACLAVCSITMFFIVWPTLEGLSSYFLLQAVLGIIDAGMYSATGQVPAGWLSLLPMPGIAGNYASLQAQSYAEVYAAERLTDIVLNYTPYVLQYSVPIMLMPIVVFVVVITAIRAISPAIGGEVQILGVSELI